MLIELTLSPYAAKYSQVIRYEKLEFVSSISLAIHLHHLELMQWVMQLPWQSPECVVTKYYFTVVLIPVSTLWLYWPLCNKKNMVETVWVSFFGTLNLNLADSYVISDICNYAVIGSEVIWFWFFFWLEVICIL
jgi:hypothetical protein